MGEVGSAHQILFVLDFGHGALVWTRGFAGAAGTGSELQETGIQDSGPRDLAGLARG